MIEDMSWEDMEKGYAESMERLNKACKEFNAQMAKKNKPVRPSRVTEGPLWEPSQ